MVLTHLEDGTLIIGIAAYNLSKMQGGLPLYIPPETMARANQGEPRVNRVFVVYGNTDQEILEMVTREKGLIEGETLIGGKPN